MERCSGSNAEAPSTKGAPDMGDCPVCNVSVPYQFNTNPKVIEAHLAPWEPAEEPVEDA